MRRTLLVGPQVEPWPDWPYHRFMTSRSDQIEIVEAEHRERAVLEPTIRDLKKPSPCPGNFSATSAWTVIA